MSIPSWLLSNFSPETLSWVGFKLLLIALAGESGVALLAIVSKKDLLHKEITFALAIIAAGSYAVERIGDDAIIDALKGRATTAEEKIAKLKAPRTLTPERQKAIAAAIKPFAGQRYRAAISQSADDGVAFWESLYATLKTAGWTYIPMPAGSPAIGNPPAGIPIAAMPGVEIRFDPTKRSELAGAALALGNALHNPDEMVVAVNTDRQSNPNEADRDIFLIVIGARVPPP